MHLQQSEEADRRKVEYMIINHQRSVQTKGECKIKLHIYGTPTKDDAVARVYPLSKQHLQQQLFEECFKKHDIVHKIFNSYVRHIKLINGYICTFRDSITPLTLEEDDLFRREQSSPHSLIRLKTWINQL